jgi:hypothetical protein
MVTQLEKRYLLSSTLIIVSATHGQSATDPNRVRRIPHDAGGEAPSDALGGVGPGLTVAQAMEDDVSLLWLNKNSPDQVADLGWQNWSQFGQTGVVVDTTSATGTSLSKNTSVDTNFQDTSHTALGARYPLNPLWSVSAWFAYDSSPVTDSNRSIILRLDRQYRYALGLQDDWRKNITFGAAYEYLDAGSAPVNRTGGLLS